MSLMYPLLLTQFDMKKLPSGIHDLMESSMSLILDGKTASTTPKAKNVTNANKVSEQRINSLCVYTTG